jgi:hypothetical protein
MGSQRSRESPADCDDTAAGDETPLAGPAGPSPKLSSSSPISPVKILSPLATSSFIDRFTGPTPRAYQVRVSRFTLRPSVDAAR